MERHHMGILLAALVLVLLAPVCSLHAQGLNNLWMGGYENASPNPIVGGVDLEFSSGNAIISAVDRGIDFSRTIAIITDSAGNLLFSTNGAYIANGDTMLNGGGLNPMSGWADPVQVMGTWQPRPAIGNT